MAEGFPPDLDKGSGADAVLAPALDPDDPFENPSRLLDRLNARAFHEPIVQRWMGRFTQQARRQLRRVEGRLDIGFDIEDVIQEFWLRFLTSHDDVKWNSLAHLNAYARMLIRRVAIDRARQRRSSKRGGDRVDVHLDDIEIGHDPSIAQGNAAFYEKALDQLSGRERRLMDLHFLGGYTHEEVAEILGLRSVGAARIALHRALRKLKALYGAHKRGGQPL